MIFLISLDHAYNKVKFPLIYVEKQQYSNSQHFVFEAIDVQLISIY